MQQEEILFSYDTFRSLVNALFGNTKRSGIVKNSSLDESFTFKSRQDLLNVVN